MSNPVIKTMMARRSVRKFTSRKPTDEVIEQIVRAGQQAPFAGQLCSVILSRKRKQPFGAPIMFTVCFDMHRMEKVMEKRGWKTVASDPAMLMFGMQDAAYMAENMVIAAESLGMGSCFLGNACFVAKEFEKAVQTTPAGFSRSATRHGVPSRRMPCAPALPSIIYLL